jgi:RecG-like helicase
MNKEVKILICGQPCSGKTIVGVVIERALKEAGFQVAPLVTTDGDEYYKRLWLNSGELEDVIPNIKVELEERQTRKRLELREPDHSDACGVDGPGTCTCGFTNRGRA